jgi:type I restriction enzyme, S subunit
MISRTSIIGKHPVMPLGEVADFLDHMRRPVTESERKPGPYPYYGANGIQGNIDGFLFDEPLVLLAEDGGHFDDPDRGIAYRISGKTWVNNHAHILKPKNGSLDLDYLCRVLENYDVRPFVTGSTRGKLTKGGASEILIPLPSLAEQRRIAAILDAADALRQQRRQALRLLDQLSQSIFLDMFGDPEGHGWPMATVDEVASSQRNAIRTGPFGSQLLHEEFVDDGIAVLGIDNAVTNEFQWGQRRYITEAKYAELERYTVKPGDVIITIMGTCGRCAIVPTDIPLAINTKHLCCITLNPAKCLPEFMHAYFLQHPTAKSYLGQTSKGAIMDGLNMGIVKSMPIPVPPITLQRQFAKQLQALAGHRKSARDAATHLDTIFAALQHRAFRGEL